MSTIRTRWAAFGAAVAVTLGGGGIGLVSATTDSGPRPVYVPIEPCRLADTRPDTIGPDASVDFDGWGTVGSCTLPSNTSGLALNVTAVDASQQTNLRFYPEGTLVPATANLNPTPGAPPTPNAVNVTLNASNGEFSVYNRFGTVAVVIDVMGYYDDHTHDDRYYTEAEVDQISARPFAAESDVSTVVVDDNSGAIGRGDLANSLEVSTPAGGQVVLTASGWFQSRSTSGLAFGAQCSISLDGNFDADHRTWHRDVRGSTSDDVDSPFAVTRVVDVSDPSTIEAELLCTRLGGEVLAISRLTATYLP